MNDGREEYLEWELERYKEDERQRNEEAQERYEQRRRDAKERRESELRAASTWPEALRNQRELMQRESHLDDIDGEFGEPNTFFGDSANACSRALELWAEVAPTKDENRADLKAQIRELQEALEAIDDEIASEVGTRLLAERGDTDKKPMDGWRMIARNMIDGVDSFNNWLYW